MLCFSNNVKNIEKYITADMERVKGESRKQNKLQAADSSFIPLYCLSFCSQWIISPLLKFILLRRNISPFLYFPFLSAFPFLQTFSYHSIENTEMENWMYKCKFNDVISISYPVLCWGTYSPDAIHCLVWLHFGLFVHLTWTDHTVSSRQLKLTIWPRDNDSWQETKWKQKGGHVIRWKVTTLFHMAV